MTMISAHGPQNRPRRRLKRVQYVSRADLRILQKLRDSSWTDLEIFDKWDPSHIQLDLSQDCEYSWPRLAKDSDILSQLFVGKDFPGVLLRIVVDQHVVDVENADEVLDWLDQAQKWPEILQRAPMPFEYLSTMSKAHLKNFWGLYDQYKESKSPQSPIRYDITRLYGQRWELCVRAARDIDAREFILAGKFATLSEKEAQDLEAEGKGFSLIATRKKKANLLSGPAQFFNHDCDRNAKFELSNSGTIKVVATRPIKAGEEILVYYDDHCFGQDNHDCLCRTCQRNWRLTGICPDSEDSEDSGNE